jgi:hypothetical protein
MTGLRVALTPGAFVGNEHVLARPVEGGVRLGRVTAVSEADVAVFPFDLASCLECESDRLALLDIVVANAEAGLRTVLALTHDSSTPLRVGQPDSIVLRTSMQRSMHYVAEYPAPICVADPYLGTEPALRPWSPRPTVGFMGYSGLGEIHRGIRKEMVAPEDRGGTTGGGLPAGDRVLKQPVNIGLHVRRRAVQALRGSAAVEADLVERDRYFGYYGRDERATMRAAYLRHLFRSDYVLCVRGAGNYSIRLFETLAAGRVPVIVDTDLELPCADEVDWHALSVWVEVSDLDRVAEVVAQEHQGGGPDLFARRQRAARAAYLETLRAQSFSDYVARHLVGSWSRQEPTHG